MRPQEIFLPALYDNNAPQKLANLSINSDLLKKPRDSDPSATLEHALTTQLNVDIRTMARKEKVLLQLTTRLLMKSVCLAMGFEGFKWRSLQFTEIKKSQIKKINCC